MIFFDGEIPKGKVRFIGRLKLHKKLISVPGVGKCALELTEAQL